MLEIHLAYLVARDLLVDVCVDFIIYLRLSAVKVQRRHENISIPLTQKLLVADLNVGLGRVTN